jgi:hypothetical protein
MDGRIAHLALMRAKLHKPGTSCIWKPSIPNAETLSAERLPWQILETEMCFPSARDAHFAASSSNSNWLLLFPATPEPDASPQLVCIKMVERKYLAISCCCLNFSSHPFWMLKFYIFVPFPKWRYSSVKVVEWKIMLSWPTFNQSSIHLYYEFSIPRIKFNWTIDINTWKKKNSETNHERLSWRNLLVGTMQEEHASMDTSHF